MSNLRHTAARATAAKIIDVLVNNIEKDREEEMLTYRRKGWWLFCVRHRFWKAFYSQILVEGRWLHACLESLILRLMEAENPYLYSSHADGYLESDLSKIHQSIFEVKD